MWHMNSTLHDPEAAGVNPGLQEDKICGAADAASVAATAVQ
jgi:hypothetical protein